MRKIVFGVLLPAMILALVIYLRALNNGLNRWHPWDLMWDAWLATVILVAMMIGAGLRDYWGHGGWRNDQRHGYSAKLRRRLARAKPNIEGD